MRHCAGKILVDCGRILFLVFSDGAGFISEECGRSKALTAFADYAKRIVEAIVIPVQRRRLDPGLWLPWGKLGHLIEIARGDGELVTVCLHFTQANQRRRITRFTFRQGTFHLLRNAQQARFESRKRTMHVAG